MCSEATEFFYHSLISPSIGINNLLFILLLVIHTIGFIVIKINESNYGS
jgi:hypothetical protein